MDGVSDKTSIMSYLIIPTTGPLGHFIEMITDEYCCSETRAFLEYLKDNEYDHRQRPDTDMATQITVSIQIGSIRKVSEITMVGKQFRSACINSFALTGLQHRSVLS